MTTQRETEHTLRISEVPLVVHYRWLLSRTNDIAKQVSFAHLTEEEIAEGVLEASATEEGSDTEPQ